MKSNSLSGTIIESNRALPTAASVLELLKPITWFPPMWAYACGAVSIGGAISDRWLFVGGGILLAGPLICGTSQAVNDWFDRHVDAINEPDRVIPSGRMPGRWGLYVAIVATLISLFVASLLGTWVFVAATIGLGFAWAYSAPPFRLKKNGWLGCAACGFSYESLPWITAAAAGLGTLPSWPIIAVALLYGVGALGIMTLNDFKAIQGDKQMGINTLPVLYGPINAAKIACLTMFSSQAAIVSLLLSWDKQIFAGVVASLLAIQALCMVRFIKNPIKLDVWFSAIGVGLFVSGMMTTAIALRTLDLSTIGGLTMNTSTSNGLTWISILRLGLVQASLGSIVVLTTSTLNRVMVVELALAAIIPGLLVGLHYAVQMGRPLWGHASDTGANRTKWILGGIALLGLSGTGAAATTLLFENSFWLAIAAAMVAFVFIGVGIGAAGTSLLALLASRTAPDRRPAAATLVWMMMIAGIIITSIISGINLDPYSHIRLVAVTGAAAIIAFFVAIIGVFGIERRHATIADRKKDESPKQTFKESLMETWADPHARIFTIFVFMSMLAYSTQDLILEPFAGLLFGMTPGETTKLSGLQHGGVFLGMAIVGLFGTLLAKRKPGVLKFFTVTGCIGSGIALMALAFSATLAPTWPLEANVFLLGVANGTFAVAAIGTMMTLAGAGRKSREGIRMGVWGAAQAIAFGLGVFLGTLAIDVSRALTGNIPFSFSLVFTVEALLFLASAIIALRISNISINSTHSQTAQYGRSMQPAE